MHITPAIRPLLTLLVLVALPGATVAITSRSANASVPIAFTPAELKAIFLLVHPEKTTILLDGRTGTLRPGPSFALLGLEPKSFDVDMGGAGELANLRFNGLEIVGATIGFEQGYLRVTLPIGDRVKAIRSLFGAVSFEGAAIAGWFRIAETPSGSFRLEFDHADLLGGVSGTGLLAPKFVLEKLRSIFIRTVTARVTDVLTKDAVQASIEQALVKWAQFSVDGRVERVVPRSAQFTAIGLRFLAE